MPPVAGRVAVVTDSTAYLPSGLAERHGVGVVPLQVTAGAASGAEGIDVLPVHVASALQSRRVSVTTSRPSPGHLEEAYRTALDGGAQAVLSVHLARELSGTVDSAALAAGTYSGLVQVVDSRSTGMGLGFAVLAAAEAAETGADIDEVRAAAESTAARTTTLFCPDTLEHLRRGGRIGTAAALVGTALAVKPILHLVDGRVVVREKVRTAQRALARLEEMAVEAAGDGPADLAVHHLAVPGRAEALAERLRARLPHARTIVLAELGAAVGAHLGPGVVGVVTVRP